MRRGASTTIRAPRSHDRQGAAFMTFSVRLLACQRPRASESKIVCSTVHDDPYAPHSGLSLGVRSSLQLKEFGRVDDIAQTG